MEQDIRLVAVDLDGTLFRSDGTISLFTRRVIKEATRAGLSVLVATGRPRCMAERVAGWLGLDTPLICCNGARVFSGKPPGSNERKLWGFVPMGEEEVLGVTSILREMDVYFHVHIEDTLALEARNLRRVPKNHFSIRRFLWTSFGGYWMVRPKVLRDGTTEKYSGLIPKICADGPEDVIAEVESRVLKRFPGRLQCVKTDRTFLEIMSVKVNKGEALAAVATRMNFSMDQVAAIGDGDNDIEMVSRAGIGVAVANGSPKLCLEASDIALSNDDDGPARFILDILRGRVSREKRKRSDTRAAADCS
ncbi:MAG: HAD family hydrolase [Firmicutes bacterium]|nr:HAD family hydrolase [Candidatus Fermentithermobacillaceae bacterium]